MIALAGGRVVGKRAKEHQVSSTYISSDICIQTRNLLGGHMSFKLLGAYFPFLENNDVVHQEIPSSCLCSLLLLRSFQILVSYSWDPLWPLDPNPLLRLGLGDRECRAREPRKLMKMA